ncbi:MAG: hypothetical protein PHP01_03150 [Phycisphaerae bacterium]|nr:hypothetical protein [Phycisphaerae bacterium]
MKAKGIYLVCAAATVLAFFSGCGVTEEPLERITPESKPYTKYLPDAYNSIELNRSTSAYVLDVIKQHKGELVAQSPSVVAGWGEKKKTYQFWLTMAGFSEEDFTVTRKYFLAVDEKPWHLGAEGQKLRFDCQMILDEQTLSEPYTSENQQRIAILRKVLENTRDDIAQVKEESRVLDTGGMMINQSLERILYVLNESPAIAEKLSDDNGLAFDHPTLGKSRVQMILNDNVVKVKIRIGSLWRIWEKD